MSSQPKVRIENASKVFSGNKKRPDTIAIDNVNLTVMKNEFITILGPSGCGKSTLLRIVAGLEHQTSGKVYLDESEILEPGPERGMVFQAYSLFPWLTVKENIKFGLKNKKVSLKRQEEIAREYLDLVGLASFGNHYPGELSGGMQQRVAIARAFANDPEILLLDEPFGALDTQTRSLMQELLLDIWQKSQKTVLFITHDVEESIFLATRVVVMTHRPGRIKAEVPVAIEHPRSYHVKTMPMFLALRDKLTEYIREESLKAM